LRSGTCASRADLARELSVSRARVTQVLNLLSLPSPIGEAIAALGDPIPHRHITEHRLRRLMNLPEAEQAQALHQAGVEVPTEPSESNA
jgi:hypothetical protein